MLYTEFDED